MCTLEGNLEKHRKEIAMRADFNLCDCFKLFTQKQQGKKGVDCDDLYYVLTRLLGVEITKDEVFNMFYRVDRDGDGYWCYDELESAFMPRDKDYAKLIMSRVGFQGENADLSSYFEGGTREQLRRFMR